MGSENIFVRKKRKKKKNPVGTAQGNCARNNCAYAELSKTGCRRCRSDGSAARPRCPAGGAGRAAALLLSPHHGGGYVPLKVPLKATEVFSCCMQRNFPSWQLRRIAALPAPRAGRRWERAAEPPRQRGNPRWALRGTFGRKLLGGFFHLHKLGLIRPDNFRNSQRLAGSFLWPAAVAPILWNTRSEKAATGS